MTDDTEWGPWIEHDGKGCPVKGKWGELETARGEIIQTRFGTWVGPEDGIPVDCWDWTCLNLRLFAWDDRVIRYRVRKPRALKQLRDMVENLPAQVRETEGA
jgi:hypothetical protein